MKQQAAVEEFFEHIVHVMPPDWNCVELKYEGWNDKCPELIKLLKNGYCEKDKIRSRIQKLTNEIKSFEKHRDFGNSMASSQLIAKVEELQTLLGGEKQK